MLNFIPDAIKGYLLKGLFAVLCGLAVWANFQMLNAKNKRIETQENSIATLQQEKKDLETQLVNKGKSEAVTEGVKSGVKQEEVKIEKAKTTANQYVEKKLAEIEAKYAKMEQTAANAERKRMEISLERAKGLWLSFCLQEPQEKACK